MNRKACIRISLSVVFAGLLLVQGGQKASAAGIQEFKPPQPETAMASLEITDMRGRSVVVPRDIKRIIALGAGSLRLLTYFDAVNSVIAVEDAGHGREKSLHGFFHLATYRIARPDLRELPSIGSEENHEAIIAAMPDIVFSSTIDAGQLDQLQDKLGVPVFAIDADVEISDLERFHSQLRRVGQLVGEDARAEELISGIERLVQDLASRAALVTEPGRAYAGGMMFYGPADFLRTSGDYIPFDMTGTVNVMPTNPANNRQPYMTSLEELIAANPDAVFIDTANNELSRAGYRAKQELLDDQVTAFRNRAVYTTLVYKYYGTNWENQLINIYYVGKVLYPGLFADVVIEDKAAQIWRLFFGVDLDYDRVISRHKPGLGRADWW